MTHAIGKLGISKESEKKAHQADRNKNKTETDAVLLRTTELCMRERGINE